MRRIFIDPLPAQLVPPPGGCSDGVAYLRVHQCAGQSRRAGTGLRIAHSDPERRHRAARNPHLHWLRGDGS